jgi:hypothetical protein
LPQQLGKNYYNALKEKVFLASDGGAHHPLVSFGCPIASKSMILAKNIAVPIHGPFTPKVMSYWPYFNYYTASYSTTIFPRFKAPSKWFAIVKASLFALRQQSIPRYAKPTTDSFLKVMLKQE